MSSMSKKIAAVGMLLTASMAYSDVVIDDFASGWAGRNKFGGVWIADADAYVCNTATPPVCGTSKVTDPVLHEDVVKNSANVPTTYDGSSMIISEITVSKDVSATQAWAYAGWVMDLIPGDTTGAGPEPWNQPQWDRKNEVDLSSCSALQVKLDFTPTRQLWIELYNPEQAKVNPSAPSPQYGWRRYTTTTGALTTFTLPLTGLGSPVQKWTGTATDPKIDLKHINRIKILYEGQKNAAVASPAPYDTDVHVLSIGGVSLIGGADCKINGVSAIQDRVETRSSLSLTATTGMLAFSNLSGLGELRVQVRNLSGKIVTEGVVSESRPSMELASLKDGVYAVQVAGANVSRSFSISHLN